MSKKRTIFITVILCVFGLMAPKIIGAADLRLFEEMASQDGDLNFYGKVIDQKGNPVPGVSIEVSCQGYPPDYLDRVRATIGKKMSEYEMNVALGAVAQKYTMVTDVAGKFALTGKHGHSLQIKNVSKTGYTAEQPLERGFHFGKHLGEGYPGIDQYWNERSNFIIPIWKDEGAVRVVEFRERGLFFGRTNQVAARFNLFRRDKISSSDYADFSFTAQVDNQVSGNPNAEAVLEVASGGAVLTSEPLAYGAPETGYKKVLRWKWEKSADKTHRMQKVYLSSRSGKVYSVLTFELMHNGVSISGWANLDGARGLAPNYKNIVIDAEIIRGRDEASRR